MTTSSTNKNNNNCTVFNNSDDANNNLAITKAEEEENVSDEKTLINCRWVDCKGSYKTTNELVQHIKSTHVTKWEDRTCFWSECPRRLRPFKHRGNLLKHVVWLCHTDEKSETESDVSDVSDEKTLIYCRWVYCKGFYKTTDKLVQHIKSTHVATKDDKICLWAGCMRRHRPITARSKLLRHMMCHTGERAFFCTVRSHSIYLNL